MVNANLNEQLYDKMMAELTHFRSELLAKPPEEILKNAEEYTVRSDIVMAVEEMELDEKRAAVLLKSATPLADVYKKFSDLNVEHMDVIRNSIENTANEVLRQEFKLRSAPLYKYPASHASEHGELDAYRASHKAIYPSAAQRPVPCSNTYGITSRLRRSACALITTMLVQSAHRKRSRPSGTTRSCRHVSR